VLRREKWIALATAVVGLVLLAGPVAAMMVHYSVDRLVAEADGLVRGKMQVLGSRWLEGPGSVIVTDLRLQVQEVWAGPYQKGSALDFYVYGGTVGDVTMVQEHEPTFQANETVLLFLWTQPDQARTAVFNGVQGTYRLQRDTVTNYRHETFPIREFRATVQAAKRIHGRR